MTNYSLFDLTGRRALVSGGSRGLGLAMAQGLAAAGVEVIVAARTPPEDKGLGYLAADLIVPAQRAGLVDRVVRELGGIDILLHAAGHQHRAPCEEFPEEAWREMLELHLTAAMDLCQQAARHMLPQRRGKIILISSVIGFQGGLRVPAYSAAKHALIGLAQSLCNDWAGRGINVNAIAPGYISGGMADGLLADPVRGPEILGRIPAGKVGDPKDLVGPAIFLSSDASNYMNGTTLVIDGGWLAR